MPLFQSTPDLVNREKMVSPSSVMVSAFQSTPDLVNREKFADGGGDVQTNVSIHSRFS